MTKPAKWIAADLCETQLNAWAMQGTQVVARAHHVGPIDPTRMDDLIAALLPLVADQLGASPTLVVISGIAGVDLCPVPAKPLLLHPVSVETQEPRLRVYGLPGLKQATPADMMQGDATRIAGFLALNDGWDGVICLPGARTRWAQVSAGEIVSFQTFVTGEMFTAMSQHTGTDPAPIPQDWNDTSFAEALDNTLSRPERLAAQLYSLRASATLNDDAQDVTYARLWGALIGAELAAARPYWLGQQMAIIGKDDLARPYAAALQRQGVPVTVADADRMTLAGLVAAWRRLP